MPVVVIHGQDGNNDVPIIASHSVRGLLVMDDEHYHVHEGKAFYAVYSVLANTGVVAEILIVTPDSAELANMTITVDVALAATSEVWVPSTKTFVSGNALTNINKRMGSTITSGVQICHTPAGTQAGAAMSTRYIGAATGGGRIITGGGAENEIILAPNTVHLLRLTSRADANAMTFDIHWYDHQEYT